MENRILELFLYNNALRFSEIQKALKTRSNKLAYHLNLLTKNGVLIKKGDYYELSESSEYLIPYLSDKKAVLPVVLVHIGDKKRAFLYIREKKPFKGLLSLPGGRLLINESIKQAAERIMNEKFGIKVRFKKINSVSIEHVKRTSKGVHSFLLILVSAAAKEKIQLTELVKNKSKIIPSDYYLMKKKSSSEVEIGSVVSRV